MCFQDVSFISISSIWLRHRFQIGIKWFWEELIIKFVFGRSSLLSLSSSLLSLLHLLEWWMSPVPEMSGRWILSEEDTSPLRRFRSSSLFVLMIAPFLVTMLVHKLYLVFIHLILYLEEYVISSSKPMWKCDNVGT